MWAGHRHEREMQTLSATDAFRALIAEVIASSSKRHGDAVVVYRLKRCSCCRTPARRPTVNELLLGRAGGAALHARAP